MPMQPQRTNPVNHLGQISKCSICGSIHHWMKNCPNRNSSPQQPMFTLFTTSAIQECYVSKLVGESFSGGVLDCGCTKSVCGVAWYEEYLKTLSGNDRKLVVTKASKVPYKFGPGEVVYSHLSVKLPIYIGDQKGMLETEVVNEEVPLLISSPAMKNAGVVLDFKEDSAVFNGKAVKLEILSSGHYMIPLVKPQSTDVKEAFLSFNVDAKSIAEKKNMAAKLHSQFGHPSNEKLKQLVSSAGVTDKEFSDILQDHAEQCEICLRYRKKNPRPIVGMSLSKEFNDSVAMDLKFFDQSIILHMIDLTTRYSVAVVIPNKKKDTIVEHVIMNLVNTFGVPNRFLSDNGGELNNDDFRRV